MKGEYALPSAEAADAFEDLDASFAAAFFYANSLPGRHWKNVALVHLETARRAAQQAIRYGGEPGEGLSAVAQEHAARHSDEATADDDTERREETDTPPPEGNIPAEDAPHGN